jgi:REP element-mobilizing transposase RayT
MSHAYARNHLNVVFSTKARRPTIVPAVRENLWAYIRGIARNYQMDLEAIGGTENHVHLLFVLPPKLSLAHAIRAIKANSSKWMNEKGHRFSWQEGYAAFSVSVSQLETVSEYVRNQEKHHRTRSFEEEFLALLRKHGLPADPAKVFA